MWALCEATFFFVIPDVWLSFVAIKGLKSGFKNVAIAIIGALFGGTIMFLWGKNDLNAALNFVSNLPTHNTEMIESIKNQINDCGLISVFQGPIKGLPYKIYAVLFGGNSFSILNFLLLSIPARAMRFILTVLVSFFLSNVLLKNFTEKYKKLVLVVIWLIFYSLYLFR